MTSNPGDEKVIQDDVHFKGRTTHNYADVMDIGHDPKQKVANITDRDLITSETTELYVAPDGVGDPDGEGTQDDPITFGELENRLAIIQQHPLAIYLTEPGTYGGGMGAFNFPPTVFANHTREFSDFAMNFLLEGDRSAPGDYVIAPSFVNLHIDAPRIFRSRIQGLQFDGIVQLYGCTVHALDVNFGGDTSSSAGTSVSVFSGEAHFQGCDFIAERKNLINTADAKISAENTNGRGSQYLFNARKGVMVYIADNCNLRAGNSIFDPQHDEPAIVSEGGNTIMLDENGRIVDDFGDGKATGIRYTRDTRYRPVWTLESGTLAEGPTKQSVTMNTDTDWTGITTEAIRQGNNETTIQFAANTAPSSGSIQIKLWDGSDSGERVDAVAGSNGNLYFRISKPGSSTTSHTVGTWPLDTAIHEMTVVRSDDIDGSGNAGYKMTFDGSDTSVVTDSFVPTLRDLKYTIRNTTDVDVELYNFKSVAP